MERFCAEPCGPRRDWGTTVRVADGAPGDEFQVDFGRIGPLFATIDELRAGTARHINFYNHQRRCAKAGNLSPIRYELTLARGRQAA
jgi:hypothetical protein